MKRKIRLVGIVLAIGLLCLPSVALADLVTSFETGDLDGWSCWNSLRFSDGGELEPCFRWRL